MINEEEIIRQLQDVKTREHAFTVIVREYQEPIYWQIRRMVFVHDDADDLVQNTFLKAWSALDTFQGKSQLKTWLFRIAINETLNFLERRKKEGMADVDEESVKNQLISDEYFDGDQTQLLLQQAVSQLPDKQRTVFTLKYFQEMKYEDMSQMLDTSVGALKASYHHAVQKIISFFEHID